MDYNKFRLFEFKLKNMVDHAAIVMIAKRASGKSYIVRDICYHMRNLPGGVVIAPTDRMNSFYKFFFSDLYIHYDIKESILKKILERQLLMIEKSKEKAKIGKKVDPSAILIMDDCLAKKKQWGKDENIFEILMMGRHYKLTYILTMQTPIGIHPDLRLNFDYVFLLKEDSAINKKKLWENYASIFEDMYSFNRVFSECTKNHRSMVIDNRKPADRINEKIFWFKAKKREFHFGSGRFRDLHKRYYDPSYMKNRIVQTNGNNTGILRKNRGKDDDIKIQMV